MTHTLQTKIQAEPKGSVTVRLTKEEKHQLTVLQQTRRDRITGRSPSCSTMIGIIIQRQYELEQMSTSTNYGFNQGAVMAIAKEFHVDESRVINSLRESEMKAIRRYRNAYKLHASWCDLKLSRSTKQLYLIEVLSDMVSQIQEINQWLIGFSTQE